MLVLCSHHCLLQDRNDWIRLCTAAKQAEIEKYNPGKTKAAAGGDKGGGDFGADDSARVGVEDFDLLTVIGKGSFGKVLQVRKRDTGKIYAMKVLNKATIIARDEMEHTKSEKSILQKLQSPFLVCLHFTFQTSDKLYFISCVAGREVERCVGLTRVTSGLHQRWRAFLSLAKGAQV